MSRIVYENGKGVMKDDETPVNAVDASVPAPAEEKIETETPPAGIKIATSLDKVSADAIKRYAGEVCDTFSIPREYGYFAAYFCNVSNKSDTNFWGHHVGFLRLGLVGSMTGYDFLESLRVLLNNPDESAITALTGKKISDYETEDRVTINGRLFPEYGMIEQIVNSGREVRRASQLVELLKMPQRGRTFYAGAITHYIPTSEYYPNGLIPDRKISSKDSSSKPVLNISSQHVVEYAQTAGIADYGQYIKLLSFDR